MSLTLAVETSSPEYGVALNAFDRHLGHAVVQRTDPSFHSIGQLVAMCVEQAGIRFQDIELIAVDCGPGQLSSVRAGVAYANGLAFSLQKPVFAASSLDILAAGAMTPAQPVLCLRRSYADTVHAALFRTGSAPVLRHGPMAAVVRELALGLDELTIAGAYRPAVQDVLTGVRIHDSGLETPDVLDLHRLLVRQAAEARLEPFATPITDLTPADCD